MKSPPKKVSQKNTRNRLLLAAARRVHAQGFNQTSIDEIARDVDIAKATFYHHFKNKEHLANAVTEFNTDQYVKFFDEEIFVDGVEGVEQLERLCLFSADGFRSGDLVAGCPICNLLSELGDDFSLRERLNSFYHDYLGRIINALDKSKASGVITTQADSKALSRLFLSQLQGSLLLARAFVTSKGDREPGAQFILDSMRGFFEVLGRQSDASSL